MSHTFFFSHAPFSASKTSQVSCVPLLLEHRAPMPCRSGRCTRLFLTNKNRVEKTYGFGKIVLHAKVACVIARWWFQIAFISFYFYPLNWEMILKLTFVILGWISSVVYEGRRCTIYKERSGVYMVYWILYIGILNCIHICIPSTQLSCIRYFLSLSCMW